MRLVRDDDMVQNWYMDDVLHGTWEFKESNWLGIHRAPGLTRWYEAVPGTLGWLHRSDEADKPCWQVTLMPLVSSMQAQPLRPAP